MSDRLSSEDLDLLESWAKDTVVGGIGEMVRLAVTELRERRAVDRGLVNARSKNARWPGQKRRR